MIRTLAFNDADGHRQLESPRPGAARIEQEDVRQDERHGAISPNASMHGPTRHPLPATRYPQMDAFLAQMES